ncbi:hypothetical protein MGG_15815 [Pyricularia oryzae 70-15]|uniref:Uncharacterized protein n=1 Tax=Pyricularia oryzae (strain 70-15 / ATCC MYA-4617 / FGSC 8958) TaxID=242507 RepID=G4MYA5_PYRO7|nr:uncharacterized protein MGG_15815 [Pyricularia oryzae 70-15]EHA55240.1 hypothetical protein MGG_15815 [Pyricularia oryzae 70-15]
MQADPRASSAAEEPPFRGALHRLFSGKQPSQSLQSHGEVMWESGEWSVGLQYCHLVNPTHCASVSTTAWLLISFYN